MKKVTQIHGTVTGHFAVMTFYELLAKRYTYPLAKSLYKLREGRNNIKRVLNTYRAGLSDKQLISTQGEYMCCVDYEFDEWLLTIPENIAYYLGYDVLPGISSLFNDGLTHSDATDLVEQSLEFIPRKLHEMDSVWLRLNNTSGPSNYDLIALEKLCEEVLQHCNSMILEYQERK